MWQFAPSSYPSPRGEKGLAAGLLLVVKSKKVCLGEMLWGENRWGEL